MCCCVEEGNVVTTGLPSCVVGKLVVPLEIPLVDAKSVAVGWCVVEGKIDSDVFSSAVDSDDDDDVPVVPRKHRH